MSPSAEYQPRTKPAQTWTVKFDGPTLHGLRVSGDFSSLAACFSALLDDRVSGRLEAGGAGPRQARSDTRSERLRNFLFHLARLADDMECQEHLVNLFIMAKDCRDPVRVRDIWRDPGVGPSSLQLSLLAKAGLVSHGGNNGEQVVAITERGRVLAKVLKAGHRHVDLIRLFEPDMKSSLPIRSKPQPQAAPTFVPPEVDPLATAEVSMPSLPPESSSPRTPHGILTPRQKAVLGLIETFPDGLTFNEINQKRRTHGLEALLGTLIERGYLEAVSVTGGLRYIVKS